MGNSKQAYDHCAHTYDEAYSSPFWRLYDELTWRSIEPFLPMDPACEEVLDAGGGTGVWTARIAAQGHRVVLADISPGMLEVADRKLTELGLRERVELLEADIVSMPTLADGRFALTLAEGDPVSYCTNPAQAIAELARVTCTDGHVSVSVDSRYGWAARCLARGDLVAFDRALREGMAQMRQSDETEPFDAHLFTVEELEALFDRAGLEPVQRVGKPVFATRTWNLDDPEVYERTVELEMKAAFLPSAAGRGGHIALLGRRR